MKHILIFNLLTDVDDGVLGFTTRWINEFARVVPRVSVITMYQGRLEVPGNVSVYSAGRERGWSQPRRALQFYRLLERTLREDRVDMCFSHMMPLFSWMAGPLLQAQRIPLVTWYAHPNLTWSVRAADALSDRMVTSVPSAYPYRRQKLSVIGQGIDLQQFWVDHADRDFVILCAGRISRVKNHFTLLRAFRKLLDSTSQPLRLVIVGAKSGGDAEMYFGELLREVTTLQIASSVEFLPPMPQRELVRRYQRCLVHVNLTPAGFGDKVAWESMSCGSVCLVGNPDFLETVGVLRAHLLFHHTDVDQLAQLLGYWVHASAEVRQQAGLYLREQVARLHSVGGLVEKILSLGDRAKKNDRLAI
jgi:glycosyltransferase involved in cell wall biosynthesis